MNRYPLNSRTVGSGVAVPNKFWAAFESITVATAEGFQVLVGAGWVAAENIAVSATANFTRFAALVVDQTMQVADSGAFTRMQQMASAVQVKVDSVAVAAVGLAKFLVSSVTTGVEGSVSITRNVTFAVNQAVQHAGNIVLSLVVSMVANRNVQVSGAGVFSTFGEYAPVERAMIVPQEDRESEVV